MSNTHTKQKLFFSVNTKCFIKKPEIATKYVASYLDLACRQYMFKECDDPKNFTEADINFYEKCYDGFQSAVKSYTKSDPKKYITLTYILKAKMFIFMFKPDLADPARFDGVVYEINEGKEVDTNTFKLVTYCDMYDVDHQEVMAPFDFEDRTSIVWLAEKDEPIIFEKISLTGGSYAKDFIDYMKRLNAMATMPEAKKQDTACTLISAETVTEQATEGAQITWLRPFRYYLLTIYTDFISIIRQACREVFARFFIPIAL